MAKLDFNERRKRQLEKEEARHLMEIFIEMFGSEPPEVRIEIAQAIIDRDDKRYFELTEPIIQKQAMREFNKK